jgi:hypothetical protein
MNLHAENLDVLVSAPDFLGEELQFRLKARIFVAEDVELDFHGPGLVLQVLFLEVRVERKDGLQVQAQNILDLLSLQLSGV